MFISTKWLQKQFIYKNQKKEKYYNNEKQNKDKYFKHHTTYIIVSTI
jgi:hypothetical protein